MLQFKTEFTVAFFFFNSPTYLFLSLNLSISFFRSSTLWKDSRLFTLYTRTKPSATRNSASAAHAFLQASGVDMVQLLLDARPFPPTPCTRPPPAASQSPSPGREASHSLLSLSCTCYHTASAFGCLAHRISASLARDWTRSPCTRSCGVTTADHQGSPRKLLLYILIWNRCVSHLKRRMVSQLYLHFLKKLLVFGQLYQFLSILLLYTSWLSRPLFTIPKNQISTY